MCFLSCQSQLSLSPQTKRRLAAAPRPRRPSPRRVVADFALSAQRADESNVGRRFENGKSWVRPNQRLITGERNV